MTSQEFKEKFEKECRKGSHGLEEIDEISEAYPGVSKVIRWCNVCGAVVVDRDVDGRTAPGNVMPMRQPAICSVMIELQNK